jgi:uncharacterized protein YfaS (alpha-2-macroglobulin family)
VVKQIKAAEASEDVGAPRGPQKLVTAEAELEAADKQARAKMRLAEGKQAEAAAPGSPRCACMEADAAAIEKERGMAQANVTRQRLEAEANGRSQKRPRRGASSKEATPRPWARAAKASPPCA